jgi:hypothetical protein
VKARNVTKGDWITVDGRPVQVTGIKAVRFWAGREKVTGVGISYKGGSRSGMLRRAPGTQVSHLAGRRGKR